MNLSEFNPQIQHVCTSHCFKNWACLKRRESTASCFSLLLFSNQVDWSSSACSTIWIYFGSSNRLLPYLEFFLERTAWQEMKTGIFHSYSLLKYMVPCIALPEGCDLSCFLYLPTSLSLSLSRFVSQFLYSCIHKDAFLTTTYPRLCWSTKEQYHHQ